MTAYPCAVCNDPVNGRPVYCHACRREMHADCQVEVELGTLERVPMCKACAEGNGYDPETGALATHCRYCGQPYFEGLMCACAFDGSGESEVGL